MNDAVIVLEQILKLNPNEKDVCFRYAQFLSSHVNPNYNPIVLYNRRSFTLGDNRFESQFWYGRALYINNELGKVIPVFESLSRAKIDPDFKRMPRGIMISKVEIKSFKGAISHRS